MLTLPLAAGLGAAVLTTSFLSGLFGMAGGMILMGILLALLPVPTAMVLHAITQMTSNGWRAWLWREHVDWRVVRGFALAAVLTVGGFALIGFVTDKAVSLLMLGAMPFFAMLLPKRWELSVTRPGHSFLCGFVCTILALVAGVSGPILDTFFVKSGMTRKSIVATKATSQTLNHLLKLGYFGSLLGSAEGVGVEVAGLSIVMALIGTNLSRRVLDAMTDGQFRVWSQRIIFTTATVYMGQGLALIAGF